MEARVSAQNPAMGLEVANVRLGAWRSRTLAVLLVVVIGTVFWVNSRYPALMKRYHAGTQVKAAGALTFGAVYQLDRTMPLRARVWRTTANWVDANRIGMTFSFLFVPAAMVFLALVPRRRRGSNCFDTV